MVQISQSLIAIISPFHSLNISTFLKFCFHSSTKLSFLVHHLVLWCLSTKPRLGRKRTLEFSAIARLPDFISTQSSGRSLAAIKQLHGPGGSAREWRTHILLVSLRSKCWISTLGRPVVLHSTYLHTTHSALVPTHAIISETLPRETRDVGFDRAHGLCFLSPGGPRLRCFAFFLVLLPTWALWFQSHTD